MKHIRSLIVCIMLLNAAFVQAQITNYIYGLVNTAPNQFSFSEIDPVANTITNLQVLPITGVNSNYSACVNVYASHYYLNTGSSLLVIDPTTGTVLSNNSYPIPATSKLIYMQFNPCDSMLYAMMNNPSAITFVKYNPTTNIVTSIAPVTVPVGFAMGGNAVIHSNGQLYMIPPKSWDINTGALVSNASQINLPGETFAHVTFNCEDKEVYGTSANTNTGIKYLSTIDMQTGQVQHVADTGWTVGFYKNAMGGNFINQATGTYYYVGAGGILIGVNVHTGVVTYSNNFSPSMPYFIQHFSHCVCDPMSSINEEESNDLVTIWPNPSHNSFSISVENNVPCTFTIYNSVGKLLQNGTFNYKTEIDNSAWQTGMYIVQVTNGNYTWVKKIIKQ